MLCTLWTSPIQTTLHPKMCSVWWDVFYMKSWLVSWLARCQPSIHSLWTQRESQQRSYQLSSPATADTPPSLTLIADMGLGKTLQSLCIMAGDNHHRVRELEVSGGTTAPPSLVVCPPTLTGHWCYEVRKFCDPEDLNPLQYAGPPNTRAR